jgi:hypothetical protein
MAEVICGERASLPLGLTCTVMPGARALWLTISALPPAPVGPGPAAAAMDRLRATAARTLREHAGAGGICVGCHRAWPCGPAHLAASALGPG